jgi:hypothetical protein
MADVTRYNEPMLDPSLSTVRQLRGLLKVAVVLTNRAKDIQSCKHDSSVFFFIATRWSLPDKSDFTKSERVRVIEGIACPDHQEDWIGAGANIFEDSFEDRVSSSKP